MKKIVARSVKILLSLAGTGLLAMLAKNNWGESADWTAYINALTYWELTLLIFGCLLAIPFVDFSFSFLAELRRRAKSGGQKWGQLICEIPSCLYSCFKNRIDRVRGMFRRFKFDGKYRKRLLEECRRLHGQTGVLHQTSNFDINEVYIELRFAPGQFKSASNSC